jgi:hypothetical protein
MKTKIVSFLIIFAAVNASAEGIVFDQRAAKDASATSQVAFYTDESVPSWQMLANLVFAEATVHDTIKNSVPYQWAGLSFDSTVKHGNRASRTGRRLLNQVTDRVSNPRDTEVMNWVQVADYPDSSEYEDRIYIGRVHSTDTIRTEAFIRINASGSQTSRVEIKKRGSTYTSWDRVEAEIAPLSAEFARKLIDEVTSSFINRKVKKGKGAVKGEVAAERQKRENINVAINNLF